MIFLKLKSVLALIIGLFAATVVFAQDSNTRLQLLRNPELLNQFQKEAENGAPSLSASGIPSANSPTIQNTNNLGLQRGVDAKSNTVETTSSVIEDYYKILPAINNWSNDSERIKKGRLVSSNFAYSSDINEEWMDSEELRDWINKNMKLMKKI